MFVQMKVTLMGVSKMTAEGMAWLSENAPAILDRWNDEAFATSDGEMLSEIGGRLCYLSFSLPNPSTASNAGYIHNIRKQLHYSVLEHANFTFMIEGVSRRLTHELVRHRMVSPSQLSQRYVDHTEMGAVLPPYVAEHADDFAGLIEHFRDLNYYSRQVYDLAVQTVYRHIEAGGQESSKLRARKTAYDAAAYALTESTETKLQVTANGRAWLEFLAKRNSDHAADEIHELARQINEALKKTASNIFAE